MMHLIIFKWWIQKLCHKINEKWMNEWMYESKVTFKSQLKRCHKIDKNEKFTDCGRIARATLLSNKIWLVQPFKWKYHDTQSNQNSEYFCGFYEIEHIKLKIIIDTLKCIGFGFWYSHPFLVHFIAWARFRCTLFWTFRERE